MSQKASSSKGRGRLARPMIRVILVAAIVGAWLAAALGIAAAANRGLQPTQPVTNAAVAAPLTPARALAESCTVAAV